MKARDWGLLGGVVAGGLAIGWMVSGGSQAPSPAPPSSGEAATAASPAPVQTWGAATQQVATAEGAQAGGEVPSSVKAEIAGQLAAAGPLPSEPQGIQEAGPGAAAEAAPAPAAPAAPAASQGSSSVPSGSWGAPSGSAAQGGGATPGGWGPSS